MKHPLSKKLWGSLVCLTVIGMSCASTPAPMGRDLSARVWWGKIRGVDADGKLVGEGAPDTVWATAENRKQYKPLVVALAQQASLLQRPGVVGVRAGYGELQVYTTNPAMLPLQVWGVPITARLPNQCPPCVGGEAVPATIPSAVPPIYHSYFP